MRYRAVVFLRVLILLNFICAIPMIALRVEASVTTDGDWNVAVLNQLLATVQPGQQQVQVGDQMISVTLLQNWRDQLAGNTNTQANLAFNNGFNQWTSGNVYYTFDSSVTAPDQRVFLSAAAQWSTFVNVHFIPRTTQVNYVVVTNNPTLFGGLSTVGMAGGPQLLQVGPTSWNEQTLVHEIGHVLGLVHEHQRSDRDSYVFIITNNIPTNEIFNFVLLPSSLNKTTYDFRSVMHYARNAFTTNVNLNAMVPLPAYTNYLNIMGQSEPPLSTNDRVGVISVYGAGPGYSSVVTNTLDSGPGSLRLALYYAYDHPGTTITFNIPKTDPGLSNNVFNIVLSDYLPSLYNATTIDGTTEPVTTNSAGPQILLNGVYCQPLADSDNGIQIKGTNCAVRGLIINNFPYCGINITGSNAIANTVSGCYLGLDRTGNTPVTNLYVPVQITSGACSNVIGGTTASARNIISGSAYMGISINTTGTCYNVVEGNYIGLNAAGTLAVSNTFAGVEIFDGAQSNLVGGYVAGARNIISGNGNGGVSIAVTNTTGNIVAGNYIGTDPTGSYAIPNIGAGVQIFSNAAMNVVGGTQTGATNVISGNTYQGIAIGSIGTIETGNIIQGNRIGLNANGTGPVPNDVGGVGIFYGATSNLVGGTTATARNIISGNEEAGVGIGNGASGNIVVGNYIGLDPSGTFAISNEWAGVDIFSSSSNLVGGAVEGAGNVISGNGIQGVLIQYPDTIGNVVQGNIIGMNAAGTAAVPNLNQGVQLDNGSEASIVGGVGSERNYISGNGDCGVFVDFGSAFNLIQGNTIGLNISDSVAIPNQGVGVDFYAGSISNLLGGTTLGAANLISGNVQGGVIVSYDGATNNVIRGNSIYGNDNNFYLAISEFSGGNNGIPAPTLTLASVTTNLTITGNYQGTNGWTYQLDFYSDAPGGNIGGRVYLGSKQIIGTGSTASFTGGVGAVVTNGRAITATITDPAGDTSQFSSAVTATMRSFVGDGIPDAWRLLYFGSTTTNSQSYVGGDADHTGMNNFQKFLAGLNPTNPASVFRVAAANPFRTTSAVVLDTANGTVYQVQYRDDLITGNWEILADQVIGTGTNIYFPDPGATVAGKRFYRALVDY